MLIEDGNQLAEFLKNFDSRQSSYHGIPLSEVESGRNEFDKDRKDIIHAARVFISARFACFTENPVFAAFRIFEYGSWPEHSDEFYESYGEKEIKTLAEHFRDYDIMRDFDIKEACNEWRRMKRHLPTLPLFTEKCFWTFWNQVVENHSTDLRYYHMAKIIEIMLHMLLDTSMCERGFSRMNRIQTFERGNLEIKTTNGIMTVCHLGPPMEDFDPKPFAGEWIKGPQGEDSSRGRYLTAKLAPVLNK